jgi:hypothetical protein
MDVCTSLLFELRVPLPAVVSMQTRHPNLGGCRRGPAARAGEGGAAHAALPDSGRRGAPRGEVKPPAHKRTGQVTDAALRPPQAEHPSAEGG